MKIVVALFSLLLLAGCKSTPVNICQNYPGSYPDGYTYIPDEIKWLVKIEPKFPEKAVKESISGYVKLSYTVVNGRVKNIKVIESSPSGVFEAEAIKALERWRYEDTYKNCVQYPKEYQLQTTLDFSFDN